MKFMTYFTDLDGFPEPVVDRGLISFSNGVVELVTGVFTPYATFTPGDAMSFRTARHHIPLPYLGIYETPMLDRVLDFQFTKDVAEVLVALLIGCVLFKVGELDGWHVMPYLVGAGGTGKGLLLSVAQAFFSPSAIAILSPSKREEVFGMANLMKGEIVVGRDTCVLRRRGMDSTHMIEQRDSDVAARRRQARHYKNVPCQAVRHFQVPSRADSGSSAGSDAPYSSGHTQHQGEHAHRRREDRHAL